VFIQEGALNVKEKFSAAEWKALIKAPMMVSYAVAGASPSGGSAYRDEMKAVADAIVDGSEQAPAGSLTQAVADEIVANATDELRGPTEQVSVSEIKDRAIELCNEVARILGAKADAQEAADYKRWLLMVGERVAQASTEGGFLGFGGARVSGDKAATLSEIAAALQADRA
jgi:hypothetical protein